MSNKKVRKIDINGVVYDLDTGSAVSPDGTPVDLSDYAQIEYVDEQINNLEGKVTNNFNRINSVATNVELNNLTIGTIEDKVNTANINVNNVRADVNDLKSSLVSGNVTTTGEEETLSSIKIGDKVYKIEKIGNIEVDTSGFVKIDDADAASKTKTYSASKIESTISTAKTAVTASAKEYTDSKINDTTASATTTYSSNKINSLVSTNSFQQTTMPEAVAALEGKVYQYIGETTEQFKTGNFYQCYMSEPAVDRVDYYTWKPAPYSSGATLYSKVKEPTSKDQVFSNTACTEPIKEGTQYFKGSYDAGAGFWTFSYYTGFSTRYYDYSSSQPGILIMSPVYSWKDISASATLLDDTAPGTQTTYTSTKIEAVAKEYADSKINDVVSATTTTYSSSKEDELLATKYDKAKIWTGTRADYGVEKENIPEGAIVNITDDEDSALYIGDIQELISLLEPVGKVMAYMGLKAPKNYLICDGSEYNIADYSKLAAHFAEEFGNINKFGGDGITTFKVPDLRGEFLRGTGTNSHANMGNGADVGVHQDGTITPPISVGANKTLSASRSDSERFDTENPDSKILKNVSGTVYGNASWNNSTTAAALITARPTNTSVLYCIKYQ